MPVTRYRSVDEMPPPWRGQDDPDNLRLVARAPRRGGVQRFRTLDEANASRDDVYRR